MFKTNKLLLFFLCLASLFLFSGYCLSADLEVVYPAPPGGSSISSNVSVPQYLKYVFDFGMFAGIVAVLFSLAIAGVLYFISPAVPGALSKAKDRIFGSFSGLLILLLAYLIITTINPALSIFNTTPLSEAPPAPEQPPPIGLFLYKNKDCSKPDPTPVTGSIQNLEALNNKVLSVKTVNRQEDDIYFYSILYESPKFRGKCLIIDPLSGCQRGIEPFASSMSIDRYNRSASGDVTFYRNSSFTKEGGYLTVKSSEIRGKIYKGNFENLKFIDSSARDKDNPEGCTVPKDQRDCTKWKDDGTCDLRQCPSLSGNIGSIQIKGTYVVLMVYFDKNDNPKGPWSFCQAFPTPDDVNKQGSERIKWEDIVNNKLGKIPNWFVIIPVTHTL